MTNYFDYENRIENEDTYERLENRSRFDLRAAGEYDMGFVNKILNKSELDASDKYNIADVISWYMYQLQEVCDTSKSFDEFTHQVMGDEWYNNMMSKWLARQSREWAKAAGMPEMADNRNIILFKGDEE